MAKNIGGSRKGAVKNRTQFMGPSGHAIKRDAKTGKFLDQKATRGKFKGITEE